MAKFNKVQFALFLNFLKLLLPYRKKQIVVLSLSGISMLLGLVNPYLSKLVVDKAILAKQLNTFIILGIIGTAVFIINGLLNALGSFLERGIRLRVNFDLNKKVFSHLQGLSWKFFQGKSTGEHIYSLNYDIDRVVDFIISIPKEIVNTFARLIFILVIIFYLDWQMAIFSLILAPVMYLPIYYFTRRMRKVLEEFMANSQNIFKRLGEVFSHMYLVKASGKEKTEIRAYLKNIITNIRIGLKNAKLEIINSFVCGSFEKFIIGLITLFGGFQVIRGRLTPGTLAAIMLYISQLIGLQNSIAFFSQRLSFGLISCKRLDEIFKQQSEVRDTPFAKRAIFVNPRVEFKKLSFGYDPNEHILKNLEFNIDKGLIALAGPSGCGKTTILNLILRLYEPWHGEVFIDGHNLKDLKVSSLREQIAVALQEPFLWNDTVENNLRYLKPDASKEEIVEIARLIGIDDFISSFPAGYSSVIGENACKISEGQKQKIAIARALLKKPKILILDEAMSSMDSASEEKIITQIRNMPQIHTTIVVSHRLSTVMACDLACFLKDPATTVIGKPQQLLGEDKAFYDLFSGQITGDIEKDIVTAA